MQWQVEHAKPLRSSDMATFEFPKMGLLSAIRLVFDGTAVFKGPPEFKWATRRPDDDDKRRRMALEIIHRIRFTCNQTIALIDLSCYNAWLLCALSGQPRFQTAPEGWSAIEGHANRWQFGVTLEVAGVGERFNLQVPHMLNELIVYAADFSEICNAEITGNVSVFMVYDPIVMSDGGRAR